MKPHATLINSLLACLFLIVTALDTRAENPKAVPGPIADEMRAKWKLDTFYKKQFDGAGVLIVGSSKVSDNALAEAGWIVERMLADRPDISKAMRENKVRVAVMAADEYTTDVPEHSRLKPKLYWDRRARGLGATLSNPVVSCGEENLLGYPGDPYPKENIFVHEFAHAIHGTGLRTIDPTFNKRLRASYQAAIDRGLWKNTYAATNHSEYWAEGVQSWFDDNAPPDALHNEIRTRVKLKEYDPTLAKLCEEVFGDGEWRYKRPAERKPEEIAHLKDYDPKKLPRFRWRSATLSEKPRATFQTELGDFDVELDANAAPEATKVFLTIALEGGYHSGKLQWKSNDSRGGVLSSSLNPEWTEEHLKRLKLPEVPATKRFPADGTIALVRGGKTPGEFVIYLGLPPEDAGDVVSFGKIVKGNELLTKYFSADPTGSRKNSTADIRRVIRTE